MAIAGRKGHLALVDMKDLNLIKEFQVIDDIPYKIMIDSIWYILGVETVQFGLVVKSN